MTCLQSNQSFKKNFQIRYIFQKKNFLNKVFLGKTFSILYSKYFIIQLFKEGKGGESFSELSKIRSISSLFMHPCTLNIPVFHEVARISNPNQINTGRTGYLGQIILPKSTLRVDQLTPLLVKLAFLLIPVLAQLMNAQGR